MSRYLEIPLPPLMFARIISEYGASTLAIFSDRRSRDYNSAKSLTRGNTTPRRCRVQSTIISSTARVCALAARYMHLNLISGAKGKDG